MNRALRDYTDVVIRDAIARGNAEAAGRATAAIGSVGQTDPAAAVKKFVGILDEHGNILKTHSKKVVGINEDWQKLTEIQSRLKEIDREYDNQKRVLMEATKLQEDDNRLTKEKILSEEVMAERRKLIADRDTELQKKGMAPVGDPDSPKGILMQIKEHFVKGDPFSKAALTGLAVSGGVAAISMALDAIKKFGTAVKETALNLPKDTREAMKSAYQSMSAEQVGGAGAFLGRQLVGMEQAVATNEFFKAAGVGGKEFLDALAQQTRRLNETSVVSKDAIASMANMAVHAHVAGVSLKEYQDAVINITHTTGMGIEKQERAKELADAIYETEKKEHLERGFLLKNIQSTYQSLATMGYTVENVIGINVRFADQIQKGTMSLQDLILFAKGMKDATQGQHVFAVQTISELGDARQRQLMADVSRAAGGDPLKLSMLMRSLAEGYMPVAEKFGFKTSAEASQEYTRMMGDVMYKFAERNLGVTGGKTGVDFLKLAPELSKMFGLAMPTETYAKMEEYLKDSSMTGKDLSKVNKDTFDTATKQLAAQLTIGESLDRIYDVLTYSIANSIMGLNANAIGDIKTSAMQGNFVKMASQVANLPEDARRSPLIKDMLESFISRNVAGLAEGARAAGVVINIHDDPERTRMILAQELEKISQRRSRERIVSRERYQEEKMGGLAPQAVK